MRAITQSMLILFQVINATFTNREDGTKSREEIKVNTKNNFTETDIKKSDGSEVRIINDFKRVSTYASHRAQAAATEGPNMIPGYDNNKNEDL